MTGVMVLILFYCRKTKQLKKYYYNPSQDKDTSSYDYPLDKSRRAKLLQELREELKYTKMIFNKDQLQLSSTIGQGESGLVYKAYIDTAVGKELVAVKTGKALFSTNDIERMTKEVSAMLNFEHPNVMSLIGVCLDGEMPLIIMPFMSNGSVLEFVKSHREEMFLCSHAGMELIQSPRKTFLGLCHQITKGMAYLSEQKFVHRDLAARNCMIDWHGAIKVADFGLTEDMYGTNYFRRRKSETGSEEKVPIRWMAPESIEDEVYNESSDVWSFGVTVWEIFICGRVPYSGVPAMSLLKLLREGQRLERPDNAACVDEICEIMILCWNVDPQERPRFSKLVNNFSDLLEQDADYLELSRSVSCKEKHFPSHTSLAESGLPTMMTVQEQKTEEMSWRIEHAL
jgi:serine/threonine protein kinase